MRESSEVTPHRKAHDLKEIELSDFIASKIIGNGSFGKVLKAKAPSHYKDREFAIKVVRKDKLVKANITDNAILEL